MIKRYQTGAAALLAVALLLAPLAPAFAATARAASPATAPQQEPDIPSDAEQAMFTKGQNLYNQGRYDQAAVVLQDFLKTYPRSIITDLTLLWLGRSYMQLGKLQEAEQVGAQLRTIKDTPFADIYEGELATARAEINSRPQQTAKATPTPRQIAPAATPTPTPRATARNITGTQTGTTTTGEG
ncbi:MAG TPA: tetratricopeptide repeat protein, partial [Pyrinomonadaceae bacterium]|nr:tetratricopeptide repeat protein [Pyrinomonadaceae bacterium]